MSFYKWLMRRECGYRPQFGDQDFLWHSVYNSIEPFYHWTDINNKTRATSDHGAVFNLEFSPEGNVLVAACEKKSVLILDSSTKAKVNQITDAHQDSVNCIRFLDKRMFATCSDDTTIALWDLRNLKTKIRSLNGHSNWVKNIEYSPKDSLLVTSAFDGSIYTWDINSQTEQGLIHNNVFHTSGLMRCRISPDGTKLVICTTGGYLMIIHDLDLTTLQKDLAGFRPSIYRLMQMGEQYIPQAAKFDHVFSKQQKKNRVELVTDFPERNDAEVVMSLQIHPEGHSFLSRNISQSEDTEWSCVHSIRDEPGDITDQLKMPQTKRKRKYTSESGEQAPDPENLDGSSIDNEAEAAGASSAGDGGDQRTRNPRTSRGSARAASVRIEPMMNLPNDSFVPDIWAAEVTLQERAMRQNRTRGTVNGYNFVYAISSGVLPARFTTSRTQSPVSRQELSRIVLTGLSGQRGSSGGSSTSEAAATAAAAATERDADADVDAEFSLNSSSSSNSSNSSTTSSHSNSSSSSDSRAHPTEARLISTSSMPGNGRLRIYQLKRRNSNAPRIKIFQNAKKLMYYKQESTVGKGFIKESCYSADGRIIASPYSNGIRLLAYNEQCSEYPTYEVDKLGTRESQELVIIKQMTVSNKKDIVLCSKFSPCEPLLVSGCQSGKIVWYHPNL